MKKFRTQAILILVLVLAASMLCFASCDKESKQEGICITFIEEQRSWSIGDTQENLNSGDYRADKPTEAFGYSFAGWFSEDGVMYFDEKGVKVSDLLIDRDLTLVAKFVPQTFTFILNAGDYSFENAGSDMTVTAAYDSVLAEFPSPLMGDPTVMFDGWFDENGNRYSNGTIPVAGVLNQSVYPSIAKETKLFAVYKPCVYTVVLDYNDGSLQTETLTIAHGEGGLSDLSAYTKDTGSECIVAWSTNPYNLVPPSEELTGDLRLYAVWKAYKTVHFAMPDGTLQAEKIFEDTNRIDLPILDAPGYKLIGWHLTNSLSGNKVESVHYSNMQDTYYGDWQITDYRLSFAGKGIEFEDIRYFYGDVTMLPIPEVVGYAFQGWYLDDPENCFYSIPDTLWGDVTLTAKMVANTYVISLNGNGGRLSNSFSSVEYGSDFSAPVPEREGYVFLGWYDAAHDGNQLTNQRGIGIAPWSITQSNTVIYAYWQAKSYVVAFNTDGGTTVSPTVYNHGDSFVPPAVPLKMGVLFNGWYNEDGSVEFKAGTVITDNVTLYANWIESTPIFDAEGLLAIKNDPTANYHLMNDINMGGVTWSVISDFSGILDGQGYKIYNLLLTGTGGKTFGMIGVNNGTIRNLSLEEVTYSFNYTGVAHCGILTATNRGTIENCSVTKSSMLCKISYQTKDSSVYSYIGAIAGDNVGVISGCFTDAKIDCHATALVDWEGTWNPDWYCYGCAVGGISGGNSGSISSCVANASLSAYGITQPYGTYYPGTATHGHVTVRVGGLVGYMASGTIQFSTANVNAYAKASSLNCSGGNKFYPRVGGLIGAISGGSVTQCYATGTVQGFASGATGYEGGFVAQQNGGTIKNCYAETKIGVGNSGDCKGRFAGYTAGNITECYANNPEDSAGYGFVYEISSTGTVRNCFTTHTNFAGSTSGIKDKCFYVGETSEESAKLPTELMSKEFLLDTVYWDESVWAITGDRYPTLYGLTVDKEEVDS